MSCFEECPRCGEFFDKPNESGEHASSDLCPECRPQEMLCVSKETLLRMVRQSVKEEFHIRRDWLLELVGSTCNSITAENREAVDAEGGQIKVEVVADASPPTASQALQLAVGVQLPDILDSQEEDRKFPAQEKEARVEVSDVSSSEECTVQVLSGAPTGEKKRSQPKARKKLKGCLRELQDYNIPGINDPAPNDALAIGTISEGRQWQCSNPRCLFQNLEENTLCQGGQCQKSDSGPSCKINSLRTSIVIKNWDEASIGNHEKSAYVHLSGAPRKYEAPADQSITVKKQLDAFVQLMWQELNKHKSGEPWDKTIFDGPFVEALPDDFPGYYKVHLNNDYLRKVFDGKLPRELQIKELAGKKSMVFLNENPGQCVSHFDTDTAVLWPLAGSKELCISKVLPPLSGKDAQKTKEEARTLYSNTNPFEYSAEERRMGSWAQVHVPAFDAFVIPVNMIHCVKSAARTVAISIQIEPAKYLTEYDVGSGKEETTMRNKQDGCPLESIFAKKARLRVKEESGREITGDKYMPLSNSIKGSMPPTVPANSNGEINRCSPRGKSQPQCGVCKKGFFSNGMLMQMLMTQDELLPGHFPGLPELICEGNGCKPKHVPAHLTYVGGVSRCDYYSAILKEPILYDNADKA